MAFVAAIFPNINGSSTIGKKKSVVLIIPFPSPISYTAASSRVSLPTINLSDLICGTLVFKTVVKAFGDILHPQPAP